MKDSIFLDSNILLYCYTKSEPEKRQKAIAAFNQQIFISVQVINEFVNVLRKKFKISYNDIEVSLAEIIDNSVLYENNLQTIHKAIRISEKYQFSYYDFLIIAAALECECNLLYSEDMQHGQKIEDSLTIVNPFIDIKS